MIYVIRHRRNKRAYIKEGKFPPRLCEWTVDIDEALQFESQREAAATATYIQSIAFDVEYVEFEEEQKCAK